jgi:hypothetical protein
MIYSQITSFASGTFRRFTTVVSFACLLLCVQACGDPSPVGAGVLDGERLDLTFADDFEITARTVYPRLQPTTYRRRSNSVNPVDISNRFLGALDDPITGGVEFAQYFRLSRSTANPEFDGATIDSVILSINYGNQVYGDQAEVHTLEVFELVDPFDGVDTIRANDPVQSGAFLGGETFIPAPEDTILIIQHGEGTVAELSPQIRIPLDISIGEAIISDTSIIASDSALQQFLPGLLLRSRATNSVFSLNLSSSLNNAAVSPNGVTIFYELNDTTRAQYKLNIDSEIASFFEHDFDRGSVIDAIDDEAYGDSLLIIQGLAGVNVELDFGDIDRLEGEVLNFAELTMVVANADIDPMAEELYPPSDILVGRYDEEDSTRLVSTRDFAVAFEEQDVSRLFGGIIEEVEIDGETVQQIRINVTSHLKEVLDGTLADDKVVMALVSKVQRPGRTVIYGPGHSRYPMRLSVTFTDVQ